MAPKTTSKSKQSSNAPAGKSKGRSVHKQTKKKEPLPVPDRIKRHFTSLCAQIDGGHVSNALKTCDKILRLDPKDSDALQAKLSLLMEDGQYPAALQLLDIIESPSEEDAFKRAYALYRSHREADAAELLSGMKEKSPDDRKILHLEAQTQYRRGSYQAAFDLYNQLLDTCDPQTEEHSDILTNLQAAQVHLDFITTSYARSLDALPHALTSSIETTPPPPPPTVSLPSTAVVASTSTSAGPGVEGQAKKKVRARRVPKGVVPGVTPPPDPERWLKKTERSTYRAPTKGRKGKGGGYGSGATQGIVESGSGPVASGTTGGQAKSGGTGAKGKKKK